MLRILGRVASAVGVTVWFGIWCLGPVVLLYVGFDDPRDPFPFPFSAIGCLVLAVGWLYISIYFAIFDELPESMTGLREGGMCSRCSSRMRDAAPAGRHPLVADKARMRETQVA